MAEKVSNVQSSNYHKHLQTPFVIYSDFESNLKEVQKPNGDNANASYSDRYQEHFVVATRLYVLKIVLINKWNILRLKCNYKFTEKNA